MHTHKSHKDIDILRKPMLTLSELLNEWATVQPSVVAVHSAHGLLTYSELKQQVDEFAAGLQGLGVTAGSVIGLMCTNRPEWMIAALAAAKLGARVSAFNTWSKKWDLQYMLEESGCEVLIVLSAVRETDVTSLIEELVPDAWNAVEPGWSSADFPQLREIIVIGERSGLAGIRYFADIAIEAQNSTYFDENQSEPCRDDPIFVMYTSGSTARPKAVPIHRHVAIQHGHAVAERMGVVNGDIIWVPVPLFWSYGGANAFMVGLVTGSTLVLQEIFEADEALSIIEEHRCTVAYTLPNITDALITNPAFSRSRIRGLVKGITIGSPREIEKAGNQLGIKGICNSYGSTESYGGCCVTPSKWPLERKMVTQGPPLPANLLVIRDFGSNEALSVGEVGQICVSGQVTSGYLAQADQTLASFSDDGEFRSGDLGFLDAAGDLHFVGRASEMIRCAGINIAPTEVEEFIGIHPDIAEVAVVGVPDEAKGELVVAFVCLSNNKKTVSEFELKEFCKDQIASYKVPARIMVMTKPLPRTDTGKLSRKTVRDMAKELML